YDYLASHSKKLASRLDWWFHDTADPPPLVGINPSQRAKRGTATDVKADRGKVMSSWFDDKPLLPPRQERAPARAESPASREARLTRERIQALLGNSVMAPEVGAKRATSTSPGLLAPPKKKTLLLHEPPVEKGRTSGGLGLEEDLLAECRQREE
ncbi:unnamed protein product, partial [Amoebophrya sp. A25]